jgi:hypothetical protein
MHFAKNDLQFAKGLRPRGREVPTLSDDFRRNRAINLMAYFLPKMVADSFLLDGQKSQAFSGFRAS